MLKTWLADAAVADIKLVVLLASIVGSLPFMPQLKAVSNFQVISWLITLSASLQRMPDAYCSASEHVFTWKSDSSKLLLPQSFT